MAWRMTPKNEVADILDASCSRIDALARDGILKARKAGNMLMISTESVKERFNAPRKAGRPRKSAIEARGPSGFHRYNPIYAIELDDISIGAGCGGGASAAGARRAGARGAAGGRRALV